MPLPGYKYLGKSKGERYLTPDGEEISKRQYRNIQLRREGWNNLAEREREHRSGRYREFQRLYADTQDVPESELAAHGSDFDRAYASFLRDPGARDPDSPLARLLVAMGLRDADADYDVGDTPGAAS